LTIFSYLFAR